jgi:hypothetical protein
MLRGWIRTMVVEDERPVHSPGHRPVVSALVCAALASVSGAWSGSVGLLVFAGLCVATALAAFRLRAPFNQAPTRRLMVVAPWAALGPTATMAIAQGNPSSCAELAPGVFILVWPLVVVCCVLGARAAVDAARLEQWPRFEASTIPALWGVFVGALALHLLAAAAWSCGGGSVAWGLWWLLGAVSALALAQVSLARRKGGM